MNEYAYQAELTAEQLKVAARLNPTIATDVANLEETFAQLDATAGGLNPEDGADLPLLDRTTNRLNTVGGDLRRARLVLLKVLSDAVDVDMNVLRLRHPTAHDQLLEALSRLQDTHDALESNATTIGQVEAAVSERTRAKAALEVLANRAKRLLAAGDAEYVTKWAEGAPVRLEAATAAVQAAVEASAEAAAAMAAGEAQLRQARVMFDAATDACVDLVRNQKDSHGRPIALQLSANRPDPIKVEANIRGCARGDSFAIKGLPALDEYLRLTLGNMLATHSARAPRHSKAAA